jgi:hypothetical protein
MNYFTEELKQQLQSQIFGGNAEPVAGGLGANPNASVSPEQEVVPYVQPTASGIIDNSVDTQEILDYITTYNNGENVNPEDSYETLTPLQETLNTNVNPLTIDTSTQGAGVAMVPADGQPVMSVSTSGGADVDAKAARTRSSIEEAGTERTESRASFFRQVAEDAEGFHGNTPQVSNDALDVQTGQTTYDIGYGHKITPAEFASGEIHGIQFIDSDGNYIPLTDEQIDEITTADFSMHEERAKVTWRPIFEEMSTPETTYTWNSLDTPYQNVLTSLHYNVRRPSQFRQVVREAIKASEVVNDGTPEGIAREREAVLRFAQELRRQDAGRNTAGMDNRVAKELYFAGLIDSIDDISSVLDLASASDTNIPQSAEYGSNPNRRPTGSQD